MKGLPVLVFQAGQLQCALACDHVDEIVPIATTWNMPGQPSIIEGFLNLRGTPVPVIAFERLFDLPEQGTDAYTPLVILRIQETRLALRVGSVVEVREIEPDGLAELNEPDTLNGCAKAQFRSGDGATTILIDSDRLLLMQERSRLAELARDAQRRIAAIEASRR